MPLTEKGREIKNAMVHEYGSEEGQAVLYASKNKGTISGIDSSKRMGDDTNEGLTVGEASEPSEAANIASPETAAMFHSMSDTAKDRAPVHKAFQGDRSLFAKDGKGISSVPEYHRK